MCGNKVQRCMIVYFSPCLVHNARCNDDEISFLPICTRSVSDLVFS